MSGALSQLCLTVTSWEEAKSLQDYDLAVREAIRWPEAPDAATHWKITRYPHGVHITEWEQIEGAELVDNWPAPHFGIELPIRGVTCEPMVYRVEREASCGQKA